jgi:hypothetical protein
MTVKELIRLLEQEDLDKEVMIIEPVYDTAQEITCVSTGWLIDDADNEQEIVEDEPFLDDYPDAPEVVAIS